MAKPERVYNAAKNDVMLAAFLYSSAISNKKYAEAKWLAELLTIAEPDNYDMYHAAYLPRFEEDDKTSALDYLETVKSKFSDNQLFIEDYLCSLVKAEKFSEAEELLAKNVIPENPSIVYLKAAEIVCSRNEDGEMLKCYLEKEYAIYNTTAAALGIALLHIEKMELAEAFDYLSQIKRGSTVSVQLFVALYLHSICMMTLEIPDWKQNMEENANILFEAAASDNRYFWLKKFESHLRMLLSEDELAFECNNDEQRMENELLDSVKKLIRQASANS